jgi:peptide/nickel transport system permease protein
MWTYAARRLLITIPAFLVVATLAFLLLRAVPGDYVDVYENEVGVLADPDQLREVLGLNKSLVAQYFDWFTGIFRGDLGYSVMAGEPVMDALKRRLPVTFELAILTLVLSSVIAIVVGLLAAVYPDTLIDYLTRGVAVLGLSIPTVWIATAAVTLPAIYFNWIPTVYWTPFFEDPIANLKQFAVPALIGGAFGSATIMRMTRAMMLEVLQQDYVTAARARGLREPVVLVRHALKNAMIPVITLIGLRLPAAIDGSVVIEAIFGLPGMGQFTVQAIQSRDYQVVQGVVLLLAIFTLLANLLVDLLYGVLDPRIRYK